MSVCRRQLFAPIQPRRLGLPSCIRKTLQMAHRAKFDLLAGIYRSVHRDCFSDKWRDFVASIYHSIRDRFRLVAELDFSTQVTPKFANFQAEHVNYKVHFILVGLVYRH